jgi:hypothetical protein
MGLSYPDHSFADFRLKSLQRLFDYGASYAARVGSWSSRKTDASSLNQSANIILAHISQLASAIESNPSRIHEWYRSVHIRELGRMTAQELVTQNRGEPCDRLSALHSLTRTGLK